MTVPNSWYKDKNELSVSEYWKKYKNICIKCGVQMTMYGTEKDHHIAYFYECPICGWALADRSCLKSVSNNTVNNALVAHDDDEIPWQNCKMGLPMTMTDALIRRLEKACLDFQGVCTGECDNLGWCEACWIAAGGGLGPQPDGEPDNSRNTGCEAAADNASV